MEAAENESAIFSKPSQMVVLKINAYPFLFAFCIFIKVKLVQFTRAVGYILLHFIDIYQQIHGSKFFPKIPSVQGYAQYGFIQVLQFAQGKFIR